ncbi:hypothetical protein GCM10008170_32010 [Methylopila capsulata]|nr:hypothetical protein GCM10008170_32010 [Methylopila capsulata]
MFAAGLACAPAQAQVAFIKQDSPCGTQADGYTCITLSPGDFEPKNLPAYRVRFPGAGKALVSWQGTVTCYANPRVLFGGGVSRAIYEYYVNLALKNDATAFVPNAAGTASVGEKSDLISNNPSVPPPTNPHTARTPVTLSKLFNVPAAGVQSFHVLVLPDLRTFGGSSCYISGGTTIVQYVP